MGRRSPLGRGHFSTPNNTTTAERILERLRAAVRETPFPIDDGEILHVTVSMGYVSVETPPENASRDDLVRRADEALYHVKRNGRDGLVNWDNIGVRAESV